MKIISLINSKGGVGKTTLAINLSAYTQKHIYTDAENYRCANVLLVDADPQRSIRDWADGEKNDQNFSIVALDSKSLLMGLPSIAQEGNYDYVFIDTPGHMSDLTSIAITFSDLVIIPVQPSPYDLWATSDIVDVITQRQLLTHGMPEARYLLNRCIPNTLLCKDVKEYLHTCVFKYFNTAICQRVSYAESASEGGTIYSSNNKLAIDELDKIGIEMVEVLDVLFAKKKK